MIEKNIFRSKEEIVNLSQECELFSESQTLIRQFKLDREIRDPMYITLEDLNKILAFKLRSQFNRQQKIREINQEHVLRRVSELAFSIDTGNQQYNDEMKVKILSALRGVHTATASAILALVYPTKYAIIDRRNWRCLFNSVRYSFNSSDYVKYINVIRYIANKFDVLPQTVDIAIWQKDFLRMKT